MTTPKVATIKRAGSRYYVHPGTGDKYVGVTSVLNALPKPFLKFWAAKVVAEFAADNAGTLIQMVMGGAGRDAAVDWLKREPLRFTGQAADVGTVVHGIAEALSNGEDPGPIHPDYQGYVDGFLAFTDAFSPTWEFVEATVFSDRHGYAGTFDGLATFPEGVLPHGMRRAIVDIKTTRSGVHEEVGLQLSAYRYADYISDPEGNTVPLPDVDGGLVVWLRPDEWAAVPVECGPDELSTFLSVMDVHAWDTQGKRSVVHRPLVAPVTAPAPAVAPIK